MLLKIFLIAIVLVGIAFAGFAVKMFFIKGSEFKKQCASIDPTTGEYFPCSCGVGDGGESCVNKSEVSSQ